MESELCSRVPLPLFQQVHLNSNGNFLSQPNSLHTVLISFIHSVQNTLSVKLYQSVPSPMIIISTFRPTHRIKTNGTERKLKVSGRKSRLLFPSGPTPQNTAFSASYSTASSIPPHVYKVMVPHHAHFVRQRYVPLENKRPPRKCQYPPRSSIRHASNTHPINTRSASAGFTALRCHHCLEHSERCSPKAKMSRVSSFPSAQATPP